MDGLFPDSPDRAMSVSELNGHLKAVIDGTFPPMWISGEITDLSRPVSGHVYFTLKDDDSQIRGVMWRGTAAKLKFDLSDGQAVLVYGKLDVYPVRGTYQIVVRRMQPEGIGTLQLALEKLKAKLNAEGLFDAERKKAMPVFPQRIGVITSPTAAALQDFLHAASDRYRGTEFIIIPAVVQGNEAVRSVVSAIRQAQKIQPPLDAVVVTRGGGSMEDLWCFNEEAIVRAVADCELPTMSAIGHEIDVTLCDMAADVRALTPTDAAIQMLPDSDMLARAFAGWRTRLTQSMRGLISQQHQRLESIRQRPVLRSPDEIVHHQSRRLDELDARARQAIRGVIRSSEHRVAQASASLNALSPLQVLGRGYSVTFGSDGEPIADASGVRVGDELRTRLSDGEIRSTVTDCPGQ